MIIDIYLRCSSINFQRVIYFPAYNSIGIFSTSHIVGNTKEEIRDEKRDCHLRRENRWKEIKEYAEIIQEL